MVKIDPSTYTGFIMICLRDEKTMSFFRELNTKFKGSVPLTEIIEASKEPFGGYVPYSCITKEQAEKLNDPSCHGRVAAYKVENGIASISSIKYESGIPYPRDF